MRTARGPHPPVVRPEFGPTLPALLHDRLGVPRRLTVVGCAVVLAAGAAAVALGVGGDGTVELVHRGEPAFTLLYAPSDLRRARPQPGELVRLQGRRRGVALAVTAVALRLPRYAGVASGELPIYADRHMALLRRRLAGFDLRDEGKARVNDVPGYQVGFRAGSARRPIFGRDVLLVPDEAGARDGVVVRFLQTNTGGPLDGGDLALVAAAKKAFRSFRFGTERP